MHFPVLSSAFSHLKKAHKTQQPEHQTEQKEVIQAEKTSDLQLMLTNDFVPLITNRQVYLTFLF